MTSTKIVLASAAMVSLLIMFATQSELVAPERSVDRNATVAPDRGVDRNDAPDWVPNEATKTSASTVKSVPTVALVQMPFDVPNWVPNEITKKKALLRAYELNGHKMCCGSIDVTDMIDDSPPTPSDPLPSAEEIAKRFPTDQVTADAPAHAAVEAADPNSRNALDAQADDKPDWERRRRFMNRTFRATRNQLAHQGEDKPKDVCEKHGMHRVEYRKSWRCRK
jgi:hypothetical protein